MPLQADWHMLAVYRLALLQAADTPDLACATLERARTTEDVLPPAPLLAPLLPERMHHDSEQLYAILQTDAASRAQLLGQFYLDNQLYDLAVEQFELAERGRTHAMSATAHAAYAHMLAGDISASTGQLEQMVSKYPADSRAQMLLALTRIAQNGPNTTEPVSATLQTLALDKPDTHLAWAAWYVSQADYIQASRSYRIATELAPPEQRGQYAIWAAHFHLSTAYEICTDGMVAAERAVEMLPDDADAWTVLAGSRYQCGDFTGAVTAARRAIARADDPRADASFYLGAALANLGYNNEARDQLLHACDLDPDSIWRLRAENVLRDLF
jgi:tetratricopeptide (TPR) repeat protein